MTEFEALRKKLLYRSAHRGTKELDCIIGKFANFFLFRDNITLDDLIIYEKFLSLDEQQIYNWIIGKEICHIPKIDELVSMIVNYTQSRTKHLAPLTPLAPLQTKKLV